MSTADEPRPVEGIVSFQLEWRPASEEPTEEGDYLLYNPCDGFHVVEFVKNGEIIDGFFDGFMFFGGKSVGPDFYKAWAKLPDTKILYEHFVRANVKLTSGATTAPEPEK